MDLETIDELALENQEQSTTPRRAYSFELQRREFFKLLGCGLVVGLSSGSALAQESGRASRGGRESEDHLPQSLSAWLHIAEDGTATVYTGKAEMGQNIRTSLSQQVAEELHAPLAAIHLVMADTALTPFDMGTFGSRTTPIMGPQLRRVASAARGELIGIAAERWHTDRSSLVAVNGKVVDPRTKQEASYGELTKGQQLVKVIGDDP